MQTNINMTYPYNLPLKEHIVIILHTLIVAKVDSVIIDQDLMLPASTQLISHFS